MRSSPAPMASSSSPMIRCTSVPEATRFGVLIGTSEQKKPRSLLGSGAFHESTLRSERCVVGRCRRGGRLDVDLVVLHRVALVGRDFGGERDLHSSALDEVL